MTSVKLTNIDVIRNMLIQMLAPQTYPELINVMLTTVSNHLISCHIPYYRLPWLQQNPQFSLAPQESAVLEVLNISENQPEKPSQSQTYKPTSLNLRPKQYLRRIRRKLSFTSQISLGLSILTLSYCKITMHPVVSRKKKNTLHTSRSLSHFYPPGFLVLGIDYFFGDGIQYHMDKPGFDWSPWIDKYRVKANEPEVFPKWIEEVRKIYGKSISLMA